MEEVPARLLLKELGAKITSNRECRFYINRSSVWEGALRGFRRVSYDPNSRISVKFSDDTGILEEGIDLGGPRREFLRLLMEWISGSALFEGKENSKTLALDSAGNDSFFPL